ncbi:MAG TPA: MYXO-CTERM sorting domain-containing protein, partial [Polyangiaceae bacterium]|nr:MYXO-CTERM sorting domain-containing protein [Polyangiaceae bacterium]
QSPVRLASVTVESGGLRRLAVPKGTSFSGYTVGDDAWLSDIGPGDTIQVEMLYDPSTVETGTDGGTESGPDAVADGAPGLQDSGALDGSGPTDPGQAWDAEDDGCSCGTVGGAAQGPGAWALGALLAGMLARRRRAHSG